MAHALRLNTTLADVDSEDEAWPYDPWTVMKRVHDMVAPLALTSSALCAATVILDERTEEQFLVEQSEMISRLEKLASSRRSPKAQ